MNRNDANVQCTDTLTVHRPILFNRLSFYLLNKNFKNQIKKQ